MRFCIFSVLQQFAFCLMVVFFCVLNFILRLEEDCTSKLSEDIDTNGHEFELRCVEM